VCTWDVVIRDDKLPNPVLGSLAGHISPDAQFKQVEAAVERSYESGISMRNHDKATLAAQFLNNTSKTLLVFLAEATACIVREK